VAQDCRACRVSSSLYVRPRLCPVPPGTCTWHLAQPPHCHSSIFHTYLLTTPTSPCIQTTSYALDLPLNKHRNSECHCKEILSAHSSPPAFTLESFACFRPVPLQFPPFAPSTNHASRQLRRQRPRAAYRRAASPPPFLLLAPDILLVPSSQFLLLRPPAVLPDQSHEASREAQETGTAHI